MLPDQHPTPEPLGLPELEQALRQSLQAVVFASRLTVTPRRTGQIAREFGESFVRYRDGHEGDEAVQAFGTGLVKAGLGHEAILALTSTLHRLAWEHRPDEAELPVSVRYCHPLLAGYMQAREAYLLQEQERTRLALERARAQRG